MNPTPDKRSSVLGYLTAFTLGVICAGVIFVVMRPEKAVPELQGDAEITPESPSQEPPPESAPSLPANPVPRRIARESSQPSADAPPAEEPARETPRTFEPPAPQPFIPVQVNNVLVGGLRGLARPSRTGTRLVGHVQLNGTPPPEKLILMDPTCAASQTKPARTRFFVLGPGQSLADVCIIVTSGLTNQSWPVPKEALVLQERGCLYDHYISVAQVNQPIIVQNRDRVLHNLHITSTNNGELNRSLMPGAQSDLTLTTPEAFVRFKCDIHPWEFAYVTLVDHPFFAVTDANGNFVIPDLPPGHYTVEAQHRKAGLLSQEVEITSDDDKVIKFLFDTKIEPSTVEAAIPRRHEYKRGDPNHPRPWQSGRNAPFTDTRRAALFE